MSDLAIAVEEQLGKLPGGWGRITVRDAGQPGAEELEATMRRPGLPVLTAREGIRWHAGLCARDKLVPALAHALVAGLCREQQKEK